MKMYIDENHAFTPESYRTVRSELCAITPTMTTTKILVQHRPWYSYVYQQKQQQNPTKNIGGNYR